MVINDKYTTSIFYNMIIRVIYDLIIQGLTKIKQNNSKLKLNHI